MAALIDQALYPWQQTHWRQLAGYIQQQRIPQALLISGPAGIGKYHLAESFARALICQNPCENGMACGQCSACILHGAQTHPDWLLIEPDEPGKAIGIDKIRQLIVKLALKPHFEQQRVVLISPAEQLRHAAANAFLKCLEEPATRTVIILITDQPMSLPATIRSRCQHIVCHLPDQALARQWLQQQGIQASVDILLSLAHGAPLVAQAYAQQQTLTLRQTCFQDWLQTAQMPVHVLNKVDQWQKNTALDLAALLNWMISWVVDIIKMIQCPDVECLSNPDLKKPLQALAKRLELKALYAFYDSLIVARSQLSTPINKPLLVEKLMISWSQINTQ